MASNYPNSLPADQDLGPFLDDPDHIIVHAQNSDDIQAIARTLGVNPQGTHSDVAARQNAFAQTVGAVILPSKVLYLKSAPNQPIGTLVAVADYAPYRDITWQTQFDDDLNWFTSVGPNITVSEPGFYKVAFNAVINRAGYYQVSIMVNGGERTSSKRRLELIGDEYDFVYLNHLRLNKNDTIQIRVRSLTSPDRSTDLATLPKVSDAEVFIQWVGGSTQVSAELGGSAGAVLRADTNTSDFQFVEDDTDFSVNPGKIPTRGAVSGLVNIAVAQQQQGAGTGVQYFQATAPSTNGAVQGEMWMDTDGVLSVLIPDDTGTLAWHAVNTPPTEYDTGWVSLAEWDTNGNYTGGPYTLGAGFAPRVGAGAGYVRVRRLANRVMLSVVNAIAQTPGSMATLVPWNAPVGWQPFGLSSRFIQGADPNGDAAKLRHVSSVVQMWSTAATIGSGGAHFDYQTTDPKPTTLAL